MKKFILAMFALLSFGANATLIIDDFNVGPQTVEDRTLGAGGCFAGAAVGSGCFSSVLTGSALGGERDMFVDLLSSAFGNGVAANVNIPPGTFSFNVGSGSSGKGVLQYDGIDGSAAFATGGLGSIDFSGLTNLVFDVLFADAGFRFDVTFCSGGGATCQTNMFIAAGTLVPTQRVEALAQWGLIDFADVSGIEFIIDPLGGSLAVDLTLDAITSVPEPSIIALFGAGLMFIGLRRRTFKAPR